MKFHSQKRYIEKAIFICLLVISFIKQGNSQGVTYMVDSISYNPVPLSLSHTAVYADDEYGEAIPIGFDFYFYGSAYSYLVVGSNGQIGFDTSFAFSADPWPLTGVSPLPNNIGFQFLNTISPAYRDIDVDCAGSITYQLYGSAPNRYFVVFWDSVPLYGAGGNSGCDSTFCPNAPFSSFQCVLYEGCNTIEVYIANSTSCPAWNGGLGLIGVEDATGTRASTAPGRNIQTWTAINEAWRFTPSVGLCAALSGGAGQVVCQGDTANMAAGGASTWSALLSNPSLTSIADSTSPTTSISGFTVSGVYGFIWGGDTATVTVNALPSAYVDSVTICASDTATLTATGGDYYTWSTGSLYVDTIMTITAGIYTVTVNSYNGCSATASGTVTVIFCTDTVWPGDADNNKVVDNNDLLPIGLGYDSSGAARAVQGNLWQADSVSNWANYFTNYAPAVNFNHADCNGDGIINADDTLAIVTNFGLTHAKNNSQGLWRSGIPALRAILSADTLYVNDTLYVAFVLGDSNLVVNNFYGIAFTYNFDPLVVDSTFTSMNFGNSWIGNASNSISIAKIFNTSGQIKAAVTRINHSAISGYGPIATSAFKITTDNISGKDLQYYANQGFISDITMIDQLGNLIPLNGGADTSQIAYTPLCIQAVPTESIHVQPNPARNTVNISAGNAIREINITNVMGQEVMQNKYANSKSLSVDMSAYDSGVYFVRVRTDRGMGMVKLVIER